MNDFSPESIYSPDMTPEELIRYRTLHGNPWKILTLEEVRESEILSKNFTNQSDNTILAGIEVVTSFP
jgi:hypothetical protein